MSYIEDYDETIAVLANEAWWESKNNDTDHITHACIRRV